MTLQIITPYISCLAHDFIEAEPGKSEFDEAVAAGYGEIYLATANGIIKHQSLRPGKDGKQRFIRIPVKTIPKLKIKRVQPQINFLPDGRISIKLLDEVKSFFKAVIAKRGTSVEAMIWVLWNQEKGYYLFVPNQRVSAASATYDWSTVPQGSSIIVDIHSHANFAAFFSGTDNADDRGSIRYSGVIGHNTTDNQDMVWRFNCQPDPLKVELADLFETPKVVPVEIPLEWLDNVQEPLPVAGRVSYPHGGYHKGSRNGLAEYNVGGGLNKGLPDDDTDRVWTGGGKLNRGWVHPQNPTNPGNKGKGKGKNKGKNAALQLVDDTNAANQEEFVFQEPDSGFVMGAAGYDPYKQNDEDAHYEAAIAAHFAQKEYRESGVENVVNTDGHSSRFDERAIDFGVEVAEAKETIDAVLDQLGENDDLLAETANKAFGMLTDESKLSAFRQMYQELPRSAMESLADKGF